MTYSRINCRMLLQSLMVLCMLILLPVSAQAQTSKDGNYTYEMYGDGTIQLTGCYLSGDIVIPSKIDGYTVVSLEQTFFGSYGPTSVTIPATVTDIDEFGYVFSYCFSLQEIKVDKNNPAFCAVDGVLMNKTKTTIYNYPCDKAGSEYHTPSTVTLLCCTSFASAQNLTDLYLTNPDTSWYTYAFYNDGQMTVYYKADGYSEMRAQSFIDNGRSYETSTVWNRYAVDDTDSLPVMSAAKVSNVRAGVSVSWSKYSGASTYQVYRKTGSGNWTAIGKTTSLTYTDEKVSSGNTYYYQVVAYNSSGKQVTKLGDSGKSIRYLAPIEAADLTISNTMSGVKVAWKRVTGADGYAIYRKLSTDSSYSKIASVSGIDTLNYTDSKAVSGTKYTYMVRAARGTTMGSYQGKSFTALDAVVKEDITASNLSAYLKLSWKKINGADGYVVYRKASSATAYTKIGTVSGGDTVTFKDETAVNGTCYIYRVRATSGSIMSGYSGRTAVRLSSITLSSLTKVSSGKLKAVWTKNSKATGYQIRYSTSSSFTSGTYTTVTVDSVDTLSKTISSLTAGKKYYVKVRCYKTVDGVKYYSGFSAAKSVVC